MLSFIRSPSFLAVDDNDDIGLGFSLLLKMDILLPCLRTYPTKGSYDHLLRSHDFMKLHSSHIYFLAFKVKLVK